MRRYKTFPTQLPKETVEPIPLTADYLQKLRQQRSVLLQEKKELMARLKDAREMGDLSENGAYKYAKIELGSVGKQLQTIGFQLEHGYEAALSNGEVIGFGSLVSLQTGSKTVAYRILSEYEAEIAQGSISTKSPLGSLLVGKKVGDEVILEMANRKTVFTILAVS